MDTANELAAPANPLDYSPIRPVAAAADKVRSSRLGLGFQASGNWAVVVNGRCMRCCRRTRRACCQTERLLVARIAVLADIYVCGGRVGIEFRGRQGL